MRIFTTPLSFALLALTLLAGCAAPAEAQTVLPEWAGRGERSWDRSRLPQLDRRGALFRSARALATSDAGALLCRVHVDGDWDLFADPDLLVRVRGAGVRGEVWGTENSRTEVFGVPGVRLRRGQQLSFQVIDRDVTFDEQVATVRLRIGDRLPVRAQAGQAEVECRAATADATGRGFDRARTAATRATARVEGARPDLRDVSLGRPSEAAAAARGHLVQAAAWRGWRELNDDRRRVERAEAGFDDRLRAAVAEADAPRAGSRVELPRGAARVTELACAPRDVARLWPEAPDHVTCVVMVEVESARHTPEEVLGGVDVVDARGQQHFSIDRRVERTRAGATVRLAFASRVRPRGALLRLGDHRFLARLE